MPILTTNDDSVRAGSAPQPSWQSEMKAAIRDVRHLREVLGLEPIAEKDSEAVGSATRQFPVFVPRPYLDRIEPGNPSDPLLLQVLPVAPENDQVEGFVADPLSEMNVQLHPGLLHKYQGRVLMVTTGACAVHCRYCFRRHFPYDAAPSSPTQWDEQLGTIKKDSTIEEVLLSGGDPLTLVDKSLELLVHQLEAIPHLRRLRIHTRLPIVIPSRVTDQLTTLLKDSRLQTVIVVHTNHANEIDATVQQACTKLRSTGAMLFNQSVLLAGVNDNAEALIELSQRLIDCGVTPYYLHQLDAVAGAAHFHVPILTGKRLIDKMRAALPGYAVPRYAQEIPGQPNKTVLA